MYLIHMYTGTGPTINRIAVVTLNKLSCGVTYTIIAGGTLNGQLVGPRSSYGAIESDAGPCSVISPTVTQSANTCKDAK